MAAFDDFTYDSSSLSGVFTGLAEATRLKRGTTETLLGAQIPYEVLKIGEGGTATAEDVLSGKTFYDGDRNEVITGTGFSAETTATAADILSGATAYDNKGNLLTGTLSKFLVYTRGTSESVRVTTTVGTTFSYSTASVTKTATSDEKLIITVAYIDGKQQPLAIWLRSANYGNGYYCWISNRVVVGGVTSGGWGGSGVNGLEVDTSSYNSDGFTLILRENLHGVTSQDNTYSLLTYFFK